MQECNYSIRNLSGIELDKLTNISNSLEVGNENLESDLSVYLDLLHSVYDAVCEVSEYAVLAKICSVIVEGLDKIISENRAITFDEGELLRNVPLILNEYIDIPGSKIPDVHILSLIKKYKWPVTLTYEDMNRLNDEILNSTNNARCDYGSYITSDNHIVSEDDAKYKLDDQVLASEEAYDSVIDISNFIEQDDIDTESQVVDLDRFIDSVQLIEEDSVVDVDLELNHDTNDDSQYVISSQIEISESQQELVDLVCLELDDIVEEYSNNRISIEDHQGGLVQSLLGVAEQIENIANAVELIDLQGLGRLTRFISSNVHTLAISDKKFNNEDIAHILNWPLPVFNYLKHISDVETTDAILNYCTSNIWVDSFDNQEIDEIKHQLLHPVFKEEEAVLRQNVATIEDVLIDLPDDVNQELLDGLLQDLPIQAEEFSNAIHQLMEQQDVTQIDVAQRIAHTLKGAGNVVGVKGIANLTHHLEDILEIQSKARKVPSLDLLNVLSDASDCIEAMSEALLGIDSPPDNALDVFQQILDWANRLDREGATEYTELTTSHGTVESTFINSFADTKKVQAKNQGTIENMLRVPVKLADELLRIAGENLISTSQIQEYIKTIQGRYKLLKSHNQVLQKLSFDLEHIVDVQGISSSGENQQVVETDFDPLELDQYHELHSMSRRLVEVAADSIELAQVLEKDIANLQGLVITQDQLQKENEELVLRTRMISARTIVARLKRGVKQACRLTGKNVELVVADNDTFMDSDVLNSMVEPLMHLLRNAVDHGIESPDVRKETGKSIRGLILLELSRIGDQILITIKDDGYGLDIDKIRNKALILGLASSESDVSQSNLQQYIFHPGFSTREEVSQVSGRGIGLDVVNNKIRELKGSIEIASQQGQGCLFTIKLPVSSFSTHSLLIRVRDIVYAISNRGVEEVMYPGLGELQTIGNDLMFKVGEHLYPTKIIESLLSLPEDRRGVDRHTRPVVLVKEDTGVTTAILVQEVIDSRDVVVKSMGPYIPKIPGVVGATVLGDGSIASVIDVPELLHAHGDSVMIQPEKLYDDDSITGSLLPYVLVVDDSLSARKSLAQFVQDLGLDVRTARDGMEAVSLIDARKPDLVLVDMEMPRMNGLELTSHIRASEITQNVPVIMITSRSTDKHRKTALDKGVNHYMVKPFAEEELASHINLALMTA